MAAGAMRAFVITHDHNAPVDIDSRMNALPAGYEDDSDEDDFLYGGGGATYKAYNGDSVPPTASTPRVSGLTYEKLIYKAME